MLPKIMGVAERSWNARPDWTSDEEFESCFNRFYSIIVAREMPLWEQQGLRFRQPKP